MARASALGVTGLAAPVLAAPVLAALVSQAGQTGPHPAGLRPAVPLVRAAAGPRIVTARAADRRDAVRLAGTGSTVRAPYYRTIARLGKAATIRRTVAGRLIARVPAPAGTELPHPVLPAGAAR
jgi:hypothetical protein